MEKLTGAKIGKKVVTFSLVITLGSLGVGSVYKAHKNFDKDINFTTRIEQMVFGTDLALEHLALKLQKNGAWNIKYHASNVIDTLPDGYLYINGKGVTFINYYEHKEEVDGEEVLLYSLPDGYNEIIIKNNEKVGFKSIEPVKVQVGESLTYNIKENGEESIVTLVWDSLEEKFKEYKLVTNVDEDIVTYCNKNNPLLHNCIYLPDLHGKTRAVRYSEKKIDNSQLYEKNEKVYEIDRVVTFYTDEKDFKTIANKFSGHLKQGEIMEFVSQENKITNFYIYKQTVKQYSVKIH